MMVVQILIVVLIHRHHRQFNIYHNVKIAITQRDIKRNLGNTIFPIQGELFSDLENQQHSWLAINDFEKKQNAYLNYCDAIGLPT